MSNEWNKLISGALQGGSNVAQGLFQKRDNEQSAQLYEKTLQSLNDLFDKYTTQPGKEQIANQKLADVSRLNVQSYDTEKFGSPAIIEKTPYTMSDLYKKVSDAKTRLTTQYGEAGKLRADELTNYFSSLLKGGNRKIIETKDGIYSYDTNNAGSFRLEVPFNKKEEKPAKFDAYGIEKDEQGNLYYYDNILNNKTGQWEQKPLRYLSPQEIQDYNLEQDKDNKRGIFAPKLTGRYSSSSRSSDKTSSPKDRDVYDDYLAIAKGEVSEEDINTLANNMDLPPKELKRMAKEVYEGKKFKQVQKELTEKQESIPVLMKDMGLDALENDLFFTETDNAKGGDINLLFDKEDNAMKVINDNYENIPEEVIQILVRKIITIFNKVRRSKGLPDYEL